MEKKRSVRFVDFLFIALLCGGAALAGYQKLSTCAPAGWKGAIAQVTDVGFRPNYYFSAGRSRLSQAVVGYEFSAPDGRIVHHEMTSFLVMLTYSNEVEALRNQRSLLIYYCPTDPTQSTSDTVGTAFSFLVGWNYAVTSFVIGTIGVVFSGMSAMSGEKWRPGMKTPY
jgi:hypothetical protein